MKQTAVDYLIEQLTNEGIYIPFGFYEQAKEMEKEQQERMYSEEDMEEAFTNGLNRSFDSDFDRWFEQFKKK